LKATDRLQLWKIETPACCNICWLRRSQEELGQSHPAAYHHVGGLKVQETGSLDNKKKKKDQESSKQQQQMERHNDAGFWGIKYGILLSERINV